MVELSRFDVLLTTLDPTVGQDLHKTRPCLVVSPDSMNKSKLDTIIIAAMTSRIREHYPTRVKVEFQGKHGQVALDQIRIIDKDRNIKRLGNIKAQAVKDEILRILQVIFT